MENPTTGGEDTKTRRHTVEKQLVKRVVRGDRHALSELCAKIAPNVLFSVRRLLPGHRDAEDIAQNALIRICESVRNLKNPEVFDVWMYRIIVNEARRHLASNAKHTGSIIYVDEYAWHNEEKTADFLPYEYSLKKEESREIMGIIDSLPDRQKEAVLLHYYQEMRVTEVAEVMGIAQPVASKHLKAARSKIKEGLLQKAQQAGGSTFAMLALAPIGPLTQKALCAEAAQLAAESCTWVQNAVSACAPYIKTVAAGHGTTHGTAALLKTTTAHKMVALAAATAIAVPAVIVGLGQTKPSAPEQEILPVSLPVKTETNTTIPAAAAMQVEFSGGDALYAHLNPKRAEVVVQDKSGEVEAVGWEITETDHEGVLCDGSGTAVEEDLSALQAGVYQIVFTLKDKAGRTYRSFRNFQIRP